MIDPRKTRGPFGRKMGPQHTGHTFRLDVMGLINLLSGGKKMSAQHPQLGAQQPVPQFFTEVGDLSWIMGLIDWLVSRTIIPTWVAALVKFTLSMFVPATRGRADSQRNIEDLHHTWDEFVASHPMAAPYAQAARTTPGSPHRE